MISHSNASYDDRMLCLLHMISMYAVLFTVEYGSGIPLLTVNRYAPVSRQCRLTKLYSTVFSLFHIYKTLLSVTLYSLISEEGLLFTSQLRVMLSLSIIVESFEGITVTEGQTGIKE